MKDHAPNSALANPIINTLGKVAKPGAEVAVSSVLQNQYKIQCVKTPS